MPRSSNSKVVGTVPCPQKGCDQVCELLQNQRGGGGYLYARKPGCRCCHQSTSDVVQAYLWEHADLVTDITPPRNVPNTVPAPAAAPTVPADDPVPNTVADDFTPDPEEKSGTDPKAQKRAQLLAALQNL